MTLEHEEGQLSETIERHKSQLERVEEVSKAVDYMEKHKPGSAAPSPLDTVSKMFIKLKVRSQAAVQLSVEMFEWMLDLFYEHDGMCPRSGR